jgi:hypothetical protein
MRNSGNAAKRRGLETGKWQGRITTVLMDRQADEQALCREFQRQRQMLRLTPPRKGADQSPTRHQMVKVLKQRKNKKLYQQPSSTVEPRPGLRKDLCELERCGRRGNANKRWLCAARGVAVPMPQYRA